jgi:UDP-N-acetyl-2-amino-2-deoxyglucuronate dehydrogenase
MGKQINIAIIGAGRIAGHHIKSIRKNKNINLVSICDLDYSKALFYGNKYNISSYQNYFEMLQKEKNINFISLMTPSGMHYEHSKNIINLFKKNIIIEKPVVLKIKQLKELYSFAKNNKVKIYPVFQNRYNLAVEKVKKSIANNVLGKISSINIRVRWCRPQKYYDASPWRGTYSHDGGALTNQGIHHIDLLRFLGGEVSKAFCLMKTFGSKIEVEDSVSGTIEFKNGSIGSIEVTTAARPNDFEASISILGSKGLAQIGGIAVNELQIFTPNPKHCKKFTQNVPDPYGYGHIKFYRDVYLDFLNKKKFLINYKECLGTLKLLHAFYTSNKISKNVNVKTIKDFRRLGEKNEKISKLYRY